MLRPTVFTADCSVKEVETVPAHILFHNLRVGSQKWSSHLLPFPHCKLSSAGWPINTLHYKVCLLEVRFWCSLSKLSAWTPLTSWRLISFTVRSWLSTVSLQHWLLRRRGNDEALERGRRGAGGKGRASVRKLIDRCEKSQVVKRSQAQVDCMMTGVWVWLCTATEMDCPMRIRVGVLTGVRTPVWLLDFTTGLTLLLLGSWDETNIPTLYMFHKSIKVS